jgi:diguanylate cyclase (GGDEF)-like protein
MARWLSLLFLAGGGFALFALLLLPFPTSTDRAASTVLAGSAVVLGGLVFALRRALPRAAFPLLLAAATVVVSLGIYLGGTTATDDAIFYVWVVLFACHFLPCRQAAVQLALVTVAYAAVLVAQGAGQTAATRWAATVTALVVAGMLTARLGRELRALVAAHRAAALEREQILERLSRAALTDELTGLPNRRAWEEQFERELARAAREGHSVCIAVLDLDRFKAYNDEHGHRVGDEFLRRAAWAWQGRLRGGDLLARYGGEEFVALLPNAHGQAAVALVERLRRATPSPPTVSAGVAIWDGTESGGALFDRADTALYQAKAAGRNRVVQAEALSNPT